MVLTLLRRGPDNARIFGLGNHMLQSVAALPVMDDQLEVVADAAAAERHRAHVAALEQEIVARFCAAPSAGDPNLERLLLKHRDFATGKLRALYLSGKTLGAEDYVPLCRHLALLDQPEGFRGLARVLDPERYGGWVQRTALIDLSPVALPSDRAREHVKTLLSEERFLDPLRRTVRGASTWDARLAVELARAHDLPIDTRFLRAALTDGIPDAAEPLALWLSERVPDVSLVNTIADLLRAPEQVKGQSGFLAALGNCAKCPDRGVREAAVGRLSTDLERLKSAAPGWERENEGRLAVQALAGCADDLAAAALERVAEDDGHLLATRSEACSYLIERGGAEGLAALAQRWSDALAAESLYQLAVRLQVKGTREQNEHWRALVRSFWPRFADPGPVPPKWQALRNWLNAGTRASADVGAEAALVHLVDAGVLDDAEVARIRAKLRFDEDLDGSPWHALLAAAGRLAFFDTETSEIPPDYETLLETIAAASGGSFRADAVLQQHVEGEGASVVTLAFGDLRLRFATADYGDYYDVPATMACVNLALERAGHGRRFFALESDGQSMMAMLVAPDRAAALSRMIGHKLRTDWGAGMRAGRAGEARFRSRR